MIQGMQESSSMVLSTLTCTLIYENKIVNKNVTVAYRLVKWAEHRVRFYPRLQVSCCSWLGPKGAATSAAIQSVLKELIGWLP